MMLRKPLTHLRQSSPQLYGLLHRNAMAPGHEVPAHFVEAGGCEADRCRSVIVLHRVLLRMEEEGCGVGGGAAIEAERDGDRLLLEGAEGAPGEDLQVDGLLPGARRWSYGVSPAVSKK